MSIKIVSVPIFFRLFFSTVPIFFYNCSQTLALLRYHLEQRLMTHLRKRHKVRDRKAGYVRFPQRVLYERYGLYKVPKTAAWKKAHA